ncbi:MAG: Helicase associated domain protein, partial [Burkholderiales bacterium]
MLPQPPRHDKAAAYARSGLFKALNTFTDLELRIAQLPSEKERGDAFEVFVEAYLCTDEMVQAAEVWVIGKVPGEVRRQLNLPSRDYGYDGVFRARTGELVPYQAKFRSGRASLPYAELATFFGISEKAERRVVLTNSIAIAAVAESRSSFQTTRGGDFDRLDAAQLAAIDSWIDGVAPAPAVREPRPHQRAALNDIAKEFADHNRATVVMACGTGKTLVALWAAEEAKPKSVLVLVPSLNLLRQTLHEWAKWTHWGDRFRFLCVCSDPKVGSGLDEIEIRPEDADFPVRTDPAIVRRFLATGDDAVSVVFCTYQSAPVVGEAVKGVEPFDLGIFDEAHKTTGREGTRFAFSLRDENLPIRKRLFLTATPRHYDIKKRDKEGEFAVVSMDDEAVYGRVAHRLSFSQAAEQKIIVPYKIIISVVDSAMIDNALLDQSDVVIKGDPIRAKWVAHQIALKRAVEEHDLKRVITFHTSIKVAAAFASDETEGVGIHLPQFQRFHVSGNQATAERDEHLREFARVQRGLITNARCLTEGVDVPSVDMVSFMNPRRSKVDIVQAVGRAMRTSNDGKVYGYVLIPLFLETRKGENQEEALERTGFDEIAQILNAMRDNDDELSEIIQALKVEKGRTGGFNEDRLRDKIEVLGPQIQLSELAASICTRIVEELGVTWDERYGQLIAYNATFGDCNVPTNSANNATLGRWCSTQRQIYKTNQLSPDRIAHLDELGFVWDLFASAWEEMFVALTTYERDHGDCNVPQGWTVNPKLGTWCNNQRNLFKTNSLSRKRVARLERLGFVWDPLVTAWEQMYIALRGYQVDHGHCNVPQRWQENPELGIWCGVQRRSKCSNKLSSDRVNRLDQLGFVWDPLAAAWEEMFTALTEYERNHGNCDVSVLDAEYSELGRWVANQRSRLHAGKLDESRKVQLDAIGFTWDTRDETWATQFAELLRYKSAHGDCRVPRRWKENLDLARWVGTQRQKMKNGRLASERISRLSEIGFEWDIADSNWEKNFEALEAYRREFRDFNVPENWTKWPSLRR